MQQSQQTNRLDFLLNASQTMFSECPSMSRYYMNEFQQTLGEFELKTTKQIERLACQSCGQISIPGLNTKVNIVQKNRIEKKRTRKSTKNLVEVRCLTCQRVKVFHGSQKHKMLQTKETLQPVATVENNNKKKKNKGKNNNLKALLAKQQQTANTSSSLGDFLSGL